MSWFSRLRNLGREERLARDIAREILFHIRERAEELRAHGMSEADALAAARKQFGNPTYQGERTRDADIVIWLDSFRADLRYAARALRHSPAFALVAVASLALGIGANTAIYTLIDAVVLRALPVPHPEELVRITLGTDDEGGYFTNPLWEQLRDRQTGFTAIAAFSETDFNIADGGEVHRIRGEWVSGEYFGLFGMRPAAGRLLARTDDVRGCPATAVISEQLWNTEFASRPSAVGSTIPLEGKPYQIVGVAARGFSGPEVGREPQIYVPLCAEAILRGEHSSLDRRSSWWMRVMGRRDPSLSLEQVSARVQAIAPAAYAATVPSDWGAKDKLDYQKRSFTALPAHNGMSVIRLRYSKALIIMMGAVGLVLLIACANVANLLLARSAARQREVAIRLAIGAARQRLVRQLLTESALLAVLGAVGGMVVAYWGTRALVAMIASDGSPVALDLSFNVRVLGFTALVATITAMIFGLIPAWRGTRVGPNAAMKAGARGIAEGHRGFTLGKTLVVAQVALSLTLLVGAGLLIGSLRNLSALDPGFHPDGVLLVDADFQRTGMQPAQLRPLQRDLLAQLRALPGVRSASMSDINPISGNSWNDELFVDGFAPSGTKDRLVWFNQVSDGYFATLGTNLLAGRDFDATDVPTAPKTAIINESTAHKFFGAASALGREFRTRAGDKFSDPYTIVGVVEDAKYQNLREATSYTVYLPHSQDSWASFLKLQVRTDGDPLALVPSVKALLGRAHRAVTVDFTTLTTQLTRSLQRERILAILSGMFGAVALALSVLGLYGVMAYTVARRRNEIGVRIALGADRARVLRMVLGDVARVVAIGLLLGVAGAVASGKLVGSFLFGLTPNDPRILAAAAAILALVALGAGLVPAMRASRVDPVEALRED